MSTGFNHLHSKNTKTVTIGDRRIVSHIRNEIIKLWPKVTMIILGEVNIIWVMTYETSYPYTVFAFFEFRFWFSGTQAIEKCCLSRENKTDEDHPYQDVVRIVQLTGGSQYHFKHMHCKLDAPWATCQLHSPHHV